MSTYGFRLASNTKSLQNYLHRSLTKIGSSISENTVFQKCFKTYVTSHLTTHLVFHLMCHCRSMPENGELILPVKHGVVIIIFILIY
jgi:hypothetical protein